MRLEEKKKKSISSVRHPSAPVPFENMKQVEDMLWSLFLALKMSDRISVMQVFSFASGYWDLTKTDLSEPILSHISDDLM